MNESIEKLQIALSQWRDSLVNLTGRNRLLNYKPTRASTIEFSRHTPAEVYSRIATRSGAFTIGTRPPVRPVDVAAIGEVIDLEAQVLNELSEFVYRDDTRNLATDKTQLEVDRTLKRLAGDARREYLDKGISVLYAAFGSLLWTDEKGDSRRSPLILLPVSLNSDGPRQPLRLALAEDELSVNPALAIKMLEYAIVLPNADEVDNVLSERGLEAALDLFRETKLEDGWSIEPLAVLANFMFAKEAMYRDLLENEEQILLNPVLQALAGISAESTSNFTFDEIAPHEIDAKAPPETTPLVLDADYSQRAAIAAALAGKSFVLDGPPGTGKSQTIANIIGALIEQGKKVLFVSEKAVALDVVRDRLKSRGLDPFILELHSHKAIRSEVAARLGTALDNVPIAPVGMDSISVGDAAKLRGALNDYADAMNEIRHPFGRSMFDVLGEIASLGDVPVTPTPTLNLALVDQATMGEVQANAMRLSKNWASIIEGSSHLWFGYRRRVPFAFDLQSAIDALKVYRSIIDDLAPIGQTFTMSGLSDGARLDALLQTWHSHPQFADDTWLTDRSILDLTRSIDSFQSTISRRTSAREAALQAGGDQWMQLPVLHSSAIPTVSGQLREWHPESAETPKTELTLWRQTLIEADSTLVRIVENADLLATQFGLEPPTSLLSVDTFVRLLDSILHSPAPLLEWIDQTTIQQAKQGADRLQSAIAAERTAEESALAFFTVETLETDVRILAVRIHANSSFFKRLRREYKKDTAELALLSTTTWQESIRHVDLIEAWRTATGDRQAIELQVSHLLGQYYTGPYSDWDGLAAALGTAEQILESHLLFDASKLFDGLHATGAYEQFRAALRTLRADAAKWTELTSDSLRLPARTLLGSIGTVRNEISGLQSELDDLSSFLDPLSTTLGTTVNLRYAKDALAARRAAHEADEESARLLPELEGVLGPLVTDQSDSVTADLRAKLRWTQDVRISATAGSAPIENSPVAPLSVRQIEILKNSFAPPALANAYRAWMSSRQIVADAFDDRRQSEIYADLSNAHTATQLLSDLQSDEDGPLNWLDATDALGVLKSQGLGQATDYASTVKIPRETVASYVNLSILRAWADQQIADDRRLSRHRNMAWPEVVDEFRRLDRELIDGAVHTIITAGNSRRPSATFGQASIIRREAEKKKRHIPVRQLIADARDVIQANQPCFMMSPLAVSQYLPNDIEFDVVIFDEASQVTPGDAINCIYRGRALITAGDQKQLPPTAFFMNSSTDDLEDDQDDLANDFESVLDLMKSSGNFNALTLRWHYRSRHEHLISYSNASFYGGKLITFPGAVDSSEDLGVKYIHVDGVYRRSAGQDNPIEAIAVAERIMHHFETRPNSTLGVVAFSAAQRDSIEYAVTLARKHRPELERFFDDSRLDGFFIKSLEFVQGDERDVIIFSIGYGPDETGKVYKNFGALNKQGGERRLNVAITRARELVEVVTSMSSAQIGDTGSEGSRHLRRYLDFAERGPAALSLELGDAGLGTDSPFEDSVIQSIRSWGFEVQPQVGVAGYRIDIGVKHPNFPGAFMVGIECDGAMYHSSRTARDRDRLRHDVLVGLGWQIHHIWGTDWYRHRAKEESRLKTMLEELSSKPISGRTSSSTSHVKREPVKLAFEAVQISAVPEWAKPYEIAVNASFPGYLDPGHPSSARRLADFVREVAIIESPIHIDELIARFKSETGVGRIGSRILENLEQAIRTVDPNFDGIFIRHGDEGTITVRMPANGISRPMEHVSDEELRLAFEHAIGEAGGATRIAVIERIASVFEWERKSAGMSNRFQKVIDQLITKGLIDETGAGLRIPGTRST